MKLRLLQTVTKKVTKAQEITSVSQKERPVLEYWP